MKKRLTALSLIYVVSILFISVRLFFWQIVKGSSLSQIATSQYQSQSQTKAFRGAILDSGGSYLVASVTSWRLFANPPKIKDNKKVIANTLAPLLVEDPKDIKDEVSLIENDLNSNSPYIPIKEKISDDVKKKIENLSFTGLGFESIEDRLYPEGSSSAQLLGFVGKDKEGGDVGYFGLEGYYDLPLKAKTGFTIRDTDPFGHPILSGDLSSVPELGGVDLVTSINKGIQLLVEQKLSKAMETYEAKLGNVIIMDPKDGKILAMASYPSFDPRKYYDYSNELFKNPNISDSFEPGSIFKPLVMAAGFDSKVINKNTFCDICDKPYKVDKYQIETWNQQYFPNSSMTDIIVHSDNVGMTFVGLKLGGKRLIDYIDKFGIGHLTGIDLQGEDTPPSRKKDEWNIVDEVTATFGQGVAVTPIQMIRSLSTIANGGFLVRPHVVQSIKKDDFTKNVELDAPTRVITKDAANTVKDMMIKAVKDGEAKWAMPKGFLIAGKTGTAQIPVAGHYDSKKTIASFVGFAPANDPKFIMLVSLTEPQSSQWGAETAAPLWADIARDLFPMLGIHPEN
ncbi:MAG: penicillin-binding protein 2 [Candidatus Woesebacteria bacterium]|nr:MAG: penicillin-binding protein 2 [Candidatus Woesebacteria bacterium]